MILALDWVDLAGTLKQAYGDRPVGGEDRLRVRATCYLHRGFSMDYFGLPPVDVNLLAEPGRRRAATARGVPRPRARVERRRGGARALARWTRGR